MCTFCQSAFVTTNSLLTVVTADTEGLFGIHVRQRLVIMNCPVTACALETEWAHTFKEKTTPRSSSLKTQLLLPLESAFWLKAERCLVWASSCLLAGQHYVTDKLCSRERIDKQRALTPQPWISLTFLIWALLRHKLDVNADPSVAPISAPTDICASSRRMQWPKRDVFASHYQWFLTTVLPFHVFVLRIW